MLRLCFVPLFLSVATLLPHAAHAQGAVAGRWTTTFDIGLRNENGTETSMGKRGATMTLTMQGDSVLGTWQVDAGPDGKLPAAVTLHGMVANGKVQLQSDPVERTLRMNDDEMKVHLISTYAFTVRGDSAIGTTCTHDAEGMMDGVDRGFVAVRKN
jgi:hypothetical protein